MSIAISLLHSFTLGSVLLVTHVSLAGLYFVTDYLGTAHVGLPVLQLCVLLTLYSAL